MINPETTKELLRRLRSGDQAAFTEIYKRYWQTLYAIAYNRLRDQQGSEDVVHDVFSSLWSNRYKSEINNLDAYLATSVKFRVLATIRKELLKRTYAEQIYDADIPESRDLSEALHYKRLLQAVNEEAEKLPEKCRLVFKYSREENMAIKEIAAEMSLSTSTIENHLNKALKKLHLVVKKLSANIFSF